MPAVSIDISLALFVVKIMIRKSEKVSPNQWII